MPGPAPGRWQAGPSKQLSGTSQGSGTRGVKAGGDWMSLNCCGAGTEPSFPVEAAALCWGLLGRQTKRWVLAG